MTASLLAAWLLWWSPSPAVAAEIDRLPGQAVTVSEGGANYHIDDISGEGEPLVGTVQRRGADLVLVEPKGAVWRLRGPLAIPRIAGPGYRVWVIGEVDGDQIDARRLGILARPGAR